MTFDENWEKAHAARQWGKYPNEMLVKFIMGHYKNTPVRKDIKILEIGCGAGANLAFAAKEGFDSYAFDGSPSAIENTKRFLNAENLKATLAVEDAANIDSLFAPQLFDVIFDICTLCHMKYEEASMVVDKAIKRLKPGGRFFSVGFAQGTWGDGLGGKVAENTYRNVREGPFAGLGIIYFAGLKDKENWAEKFSSSSIDELSHTVNNRKNVIKYYILAAQK